MHPSRPAFATPLVSLLAALALLSASGCGGKGLPGIPGNAPPKPMAKRTLRPEDAVSPYMVAAVAAGKEASTGLQLKYELQGHPGVGEPLDIDLVIIPANPLDSLSGQIQGEEGLDVVGGGQIPAADKPVPGTPIRHTVKVVPRKDGIFVLSAAISTVAGGPPQVQTFSIPLIAGSGLPGLGPSPQAGATAPAKGGPTAAVAH
jgi:hypothetical protein